MTLKINSEVLSTIPMRVRIVNELSVIVDVVVTVKHTLPDIIATGIEVNGNYQHGSRIINQLENSSTFMNHFWQLFPVRICLMIIFVIISIFVIIVEFFKRISK